MSWFKILFKQSNKAFIIVKINTVVLSTVFYKKKSKKSNLKVQFHGIFKLSFYCKTPPEYFKVAIL